MTYPEYTDAQLKAALDGLLQGSTNVEVDGRHLFGFQDPNHELSKLQSITAHRILDYETYLVRFCFRFRFGVAGPFSVISFGN